MNQTAERLRYGRLGDAATIADYHHRCWLQAFAPIVSDQVMENIEPRVARWQEWLADSSEFTVVVATGADDTPLAHLAVRGNELVHLFVDPDHHRSGHGQALLAIAERIIRQAGHDQAELHTMVGNTPAIELYVSKGWVVTDQLVTETLANGATYDEHVLVKDLTTTAHVQANQTHWDANASEWIERGRNSWRRDAHWGEMGLAESEVGLLEDVGGRDVVELGCGTGYVSSWCLRAGARSAVALDISTEQLRTAQHLQGEFDIAFPLVRANAERVPLRDDSFDLAINEYGAAHWCDPYRWIPEAARVLRPGGMLKFLVWSTLMSVMAPPFEQQQTSTQLARPQRDLRRVEFPDFDGIQFALTHGNWIKLLTENGFVVDRLAELYAPLDGDADRYSYFDASWAKQWPAEEVWFATLQA